MTAKFRQGDRVKVIFSDKNTINLPVGSTGTVFEDSNLPVIYVVMDDEKYNIHNIAYDDNSTKAYAVFVESLELEFTPDDLEQTKHKILKYNDFFGGSISDVETIKNAKTKHELNDIIWEHESFLEDQLSDAKSHLSNFKRSLLFLKD